MTKSHQRPTSLISTGILLEQIVRQLYPERAPGALQPLQWSILRFVHRQPSGDATVSATARFIGISHAPISRSIATLCKKGFLQSKKNKTDRRSAIYTLTSQGKQTMDADPFLRLGPGIESLSGHDRAQFMRQLRQVLIELAKEGD